MVFGRNVSRISVLRLWHFVSSQLLDGRLTGRRGFGADARDFNRQRQGWQSLQEAKSEGDGEADEKTTKAIWPWLLGLSVAYTLIVFITIHWAHQDAWTDYEIRTLTRGSSKLPISEHPVVKAIIARELPKLSDVHSTADDGRREKLVGAYKPFFDQNPELQIALARAILTRQEQLATSAVAGKLTTAEIKEYRPFVGIDFRRSVYYGLVRQRGQDQVTPEDALLPGQSLDELKLARTLAQRAMVQSPLDVMSRYLLLQTSFVEPEKPETSRLWVEQCQRLWPNSPSVLVPIARLAAVSPADELSLQAVQRALRQQPTAFEQLWPFIEQIPDNEIRDQAIPDDPNVLILTVESKLPSREAKDHFAQRLRETLDRGSSELGESRLCYIRGNWSATAKIFQQRSRHCREGCCLSRIMRPCDFCIAKCCNKWATWKARSSKPVLVYFLLRRMSSTKQVA